MGKKSNSTTNSKNKNIYGKTTLTNPYVTSQTTNNGTSANFNKGSAYDSINSFVNTNMNNLLDQYLNPTLDSVSNKAKINTFMNSLNSQTNKNLENNIINPLSNRNMIRSSQATNLYNNLAETNAGQIGTYLNELLANSQNDTAKVLSNLLTWYTNGYNILSDAQKQSLSASQGNSTQEQNTNVTNGSKVSYSDFANFLNDIVGAIKVV